jgi:hypothetical protein
MRSGLNSPRQLRIAILLNALRLLYEGDEIAGHNSPIYQLAVSAFAIVTPRKLRVRVRCVISGVTYHDPSSKTAGASR